MATVQKFKDLEVWQLAREISQEIYPLTFHDPIAKDLRYKDQIRGTCGSIMDNIAEGFGRRSRREFINSLTISRGELDELKSQLYRGSDVGFFSNVQFKIFYEKADLLDKKLTSFINYLNNTKIRGQKFKEEN